MKTKIKEQLHNPRELEVLFRSDKQAFKKAFDELYPEIQTELTAQLWHERLNFEQSRVSKSSKQELILVFVLSLLAGILAKWPDFFGIDPDSYFPRNIGFIVFPALSAYFLWKRKVDLKKSLLIGLTFLIAAVYINLLPNLPESDTLILACIHLPLFLWSIFGFSFVGVDTNANQKRIQFLRFNGDLLVMTGLILISGGLLTAFTIGLFQLIDIPIEAFYMKNVAVWGIAAAPIIGTFLVQNNADLVSKIAPTIARIFSPLVFVMLVIYLGAILFTGNDPYNDREFLLIFNLLLIAVMALILFSIAETSRNEANKWSILLLLGLSLITIILNGIALSAIVFRISEWGFTPNRLAVLGGNILILSNLLMVAFRLFKATKNPSSIELAEKSIAGFLPIYSAWTLFVIVLFPLIFGF